MSAVGFSPSLKITLGTFVTFSCWYVSVFFGKGLLRLLVLHLQNLPPVSCVSVGVCSNRNSLVGVVVKKQVLIPAILRCDLHTVQNILDQLKS